MKIDLTVFQHEEREQYFEERENTSSVLHHSAFHAVVLRFVKWRYSQVLK